MFFLTWLLVFTVQRYNVNTAFSYHDMLRCRKTSFATSSAMLPLTTYLNTLFCMFTYSLTPSFF